MTLRAEQWDACELTPELFALACGESHPKKRASTKYEQEDVSQIRTKCLMREVHITSANGMSVAFEMNRPKDDLPTNEDIVRRILRQPGPWRVALAEYGAEGDPHITSTVLKVARSKSIVEAERLLCADIPQGVVVLLTGFTNAHVSKMAERIEAEEAESVMLSVDECAVESVYTPSSQTTSQEATA